MQYFWENVDWEKQDPHLKGLQAMAFQRPWPFTLEEKGFYLIRGPRQVGKTCWLKSILSAHSKTKKCFYLSCEEITDFRDLGHILKSIRETSVILLDEVSFIDGWDRAVKHFIDSGYDGILCVTGSHAYDLEKGADLMPGRFGKNGGEFHLLPMDFFEFERARRQAGWLSEDPIQEMKAYFRCGGFPAAVNAAGPTAKPTAKIKETYLRRLKGDFKKNGKDPDKLIEVLVQIALTMQNPISFQTFAKKTSIGSPNTVIEYLSLLESSFALRKLYAVDIDTGGAKFRQEKKFYFTDPLIFAIAEDLSGSKINSAEEKIAEMVVNEHLARRYQRFGYVRNTKGEIDFVSAKKWALEVKWSPVALNLSKAFHSLAVPKKIVWTFQNYLKEWP